MGASCHYPYVHVQHVTPPVPRGPVCSDSGWRRRKALPARLLSLARLSLARLSLARLTLARLGYRGCLKQGQENTIGAYAVVHVAVRVIE